MIGQAELADILDHTAESVTLDFKLRVGWTTTSSKIELAKDVVCMANRSGGLLVYGVDQGRSGSSG